MTHERPLAFEGAADLRRMLGELGRAETNPPRGAEAELSREERMAASMDAELSRLVSARRRGRRLAGAALAAAAAALLAFGARHWAPGSGALAISQEPLAAKSVKDPAPAPAAPVPAPAVESAVQHLHAPPRVSGASPSASSAPSVAVPAQSTLAEENQWFKEAAEAGRNGDVEGALTRLERLLREHPQSPLAQTALVRKFRLLAKAGRAEEARREAQRYLAAYPTGFALNEAQALESGAATGSAPSVDPQEQQAP